VEKEQKEKLEKMKREVLAAKRKKGGNVTPFMGGAVIRFK